MIDKVKAILGLGLLGVMSIYAPQDNSTLAGRTIGKPMTEVGESMTTDVNLLLAKGIDAYDNDRGMNSELDLLEEDIMLAVGMPLSGEDNEAYNRGMNSSYDLLG